jgi:hypothetical protein
MLNSTALVNYWLCFYFLRTCGLAFAEITAGVEKEDSLADVLKVRSSVCSCMYPGSDLQFDCHFMSIRCW